MQVKADIVLDTLILESSTSEWDDSDVDLPENTPLQQPAVVAAAAAEAKDSITVSVAKPAVKKADSDTWDSEEEDEKEENPKSFDVKNQSPGKSITDKPNNKKSLNESELKEVSFYLSRCKVLICALGRCKHTSCHVDYQSW